MNTGNVQAARDTGPVRTTSSMVNGMLQDWQLLGKVRSQFIETMEPFKFCPADIIYNPYNPDARQFALDFANALSEAGWNITIGPAAKPPDGIKIVTRTGALHADEIHAVVKWLRTAGLDAKVRVRAELETEAIQIAFGSVPHAMRRA
jgi:hypothetical protein